MKNSIINKTCLTKGISSKIVIVCGSLLLAFTTMADESTYILDKNSRMQVITSIINELEQGYVFPIKAVRAGQNLRNRQQKNDYQSINDGNEFAKTLTEHLLQATGDTFTG